jgi:SNF2 family DNA or RNA helicase
MCGADFTPQIIATSQDRPHTEIFPVCIVTYDILWRIVKAQNKKRDELETKFREELKLGEWEILPDEYEAKLPHVENPFVDKFKCVILDECQQIKNQNSRRAQQVRDICRTVPHVIATSGSPIENNAGEYFTILNILHPERFRNYKDYVLNYCDAYQ